MNVAELFDIVVPRLSAPVSEPIYSAVNAVTDALVRKAAQRRLSVARASSLVNTIASQAVITLPDNYRLMDGSPRIGINALSPMSPGGEALFSQTGQPGYYSMAGNRMTLAPTPDKIYQIYVPFFVLAEKVYDLADPLPFSGLLDDAYPELTVMVMTAGRMALVTKEGEALLTQALLPLILGEEQAVAEGINNRSQYL